MTLVQIFACLAGMDTAIFAVLGGIGAVVALSDDGDTFDASAAALFGAMSAANGFALWCILSVPS